MGFWIIVTFLLLAAVVRGKDTPETCKQNSREEATAGQNYTLYLNYSQCPEPCRLMLTKNSTDFYHWYKDTHVLVYKDLSSEEREKLKKRICASHLKENPIHLTFCPVEMMDEGQYCLEHVGTCFMCVDFVVQNASSPKTRNETTMDKKMEIFGTVAVLVLILIGIVFLGVRWIRRKRAEPNSSNDPNNEVEMQELNGPRDEERNMNPHTVLCCVSGD